MVVKEELILEAKKKLHALETKLLSIHGKRIKNVNDKLAMNELM